MWNVKIDMEKFNNKNKVSFTQSLIEERKKNQHIKISW